MQKRIDPPLLTEDPKRILGVTETAGDAKIRAAYLEKIKQYPPDRFPEEFEQIRDAYGLLADPRSRMRWLMQSANPEALLASLLDDRKPARRFAGPEPWIEAMRNR